MKIEEWSYCLRNKAQWQEWSVLHPLSLVKWSWKSLCLSSRLSHVWSATSRLTLCFFFMWVSSHRSMTGRTVDVYIDFLFLNHPSNEHLINGSCHLRDLQTNKQLKHWHICATLDFHSLDLGAYPSIHPSIYQWVWWILPRAQRSKCPKQSFHIPRTRLTAVTLSRTHRAPAWRSDSCRCSAHRLRLYPNIYAKYTAAFFPKLVFHSFKYFDHKSHK